MDFGNASKLIPLGNNLVVPRSDILATVGGVAVDLSPEKTVQSAQAGDAVRVDIGQRDPRDLQQDVQDKRIETDRRQDQARRESDLRATSLLDVIERRLVIDPPTIRTMPNSPRVWAKVSTIAVRSPGQARGRSTFHKARHGDMPQQAAASRNATGIASNPRWAGWIAKGRLKITEARTRPSKLNASG